MEKNEMSDVAGMLTSTSRMPNNIIYIEAMQSENKIRYYRDTQLWPIQDELNCEGWLANFVDGEEKDIAKRILDFYVYLPDIIIDKLLQTVVGHCGYYFIKKDPTWTHDSFKNNCVYSFIPGEKPHTTDSGYIYVRKLRDKLYIPSDRILDFYQLMFYLNQATEPQNVILVDDIVGTGLQCDNAWNNLSLPFIKKTLSQIAREKGHRIVYAPLLINSLGYNRVTRNCIGLELKYIYMLGEEYNLFSPKCLCWDNDIKRYHHGTQLIQEKSIALNIPTDPTSEYYYRGFGSQGLALSFSHGMPDACIPLLYWSSDNWTPLVSKSYHRNN